MHQSHPHLRTPVAGWPRRGAVVGERCVRTVALVALALAAGLGLFGNAAPAAAAGVAVVKTADGIPPIDEAVEALKKALAVPVAVESIDAVRER